MNSTTPTIIAINGSPHAGNGNTYMMLDMLRAPLLEQGFLLEIINLVEYDIKFCTGCGFCLENGGCWIDDDHHEIVSKLMAAPGVILASPVFFLQVTGQMKTFLDRSLTFGHKPRPAWKPGLAVSVSAGMGETETGNYLGLVMRTFGAFPVGSLTAISVVPGEFIGKTAVESRAGDLARDLATAIKEQRRYPATDWDLRYYHFMSTLVEGHKDSVMRDDDAHWRKHRLYDGFGTYVQQQTSRSENNQAIRNAWVSSMIETQKKQKKTQTAPQASQSLVSPQEAETCEELLRIIPLRFNKGAADGLAAIYQFEVNGAENFTAHLKIKDGTCTYQAGPAGNPSIVIKTPADVWMAIYRGEMNGQTAFMTGKYRAEGDVTLLLRLQSLFRT